MEWNGLSERLESVLMKARSTRFLGEDFWTAWRAAFAALELVSSELQYILMPITVELIRIPIFLQRVLGPGIHQFHNMSTLDQL